MILWKIFEEVAHNDYIRTVRYLFDVHRKESRRRFTRLSIDYEYCDTKILIEKAKHLCIQFDKDSNHLWKHVFNKIILSEMFFYRTIKC